MNEPDYRPDLSDLPADFVFGTATSAYQIEGGVELEGRGPSIWDEFCARPGAIKDGSSGAVACDSYRLWATDLDLVASLGLSAYRFSLAWPRIFPDDSGRLNTAGLDHYERVVDGLLERGLAPYLTLYHWDLPSWLHRRGGWTHRDTAHAFAEYADAVATRLGDRVASYATLNEPWCSAFLGYGNGEHAPGVRDPEACQAAIHHLLLGHGLAVERLRGASSSPVGIVLNFTPAYPSAPGDPADIEAARRHRLLNDDVFLGPLFGGGYPSELRDTAPTLTSHVRPGDTAVIGQPLDFLGVNYYTRTLVRNAPGTDWPAVGHVEAVNAVHTAMGWEVFPQGLTDLLGDLDRLTGLPLYVTENGAAFVDPPADAAGRIVDEQRWRYLVDHLSAVNDARRAGADVRGYFAWSLLDNFEWAHGYTKDFGLVAVDPATMQRRPKASAERLSALAQRQRERLREPLERG